VPEPIQSAGRNMSVYEPSQDVSSAAPAPEPPQSAASAPPPSPPGVTALVNKNPPPASMQCSSEKTALALATGNLVRAAGGMTVATTTIIGAIPAIASFIGSAIAVGATVAALANCEDAAAAKAKAKVP
jgi:hypothetical protein